MNVLLNFVDVYTAEKIWGYKQYMEDIEKHKRLMIPVLAKIKKVTQLQFYEEWGYSSYISYKILNEAIDKIYKTSWNLNIFPQLRITGFIDEGLSWVYMDGPISRPYSSDKYLVESIDEYYPPNTSEYTNILIEKIKNIIIMIDTIDKNLTLFYL